MESVSTTFISSIAEYGPGWLLGSGILIIAGYVIHRWMGIYEKHQDERTKSQTEITKISGQMVEQMDRSNTVLENVQNQMSVMNSTNATLVEQLVESRNRSNDMGRNVSEIHDKISFLYEHLIKRGM